MTGETWVQFAQFSTILVGFLGVVVALRSHRRQMNAQMFIEFSARFESVLRALPAQAWITNGDANERIPPPSEDLTKCALQCFHFLADLYHLHEEGYVSQDLWRPWQLGIKRTLQSPLLQREWFAVEEAFSHHPEYCRYIRGLIAEDGRVPSRGLRSRRQIALHAP
jgi:hypothetical protein